MQIFKKFDSKEFLKELDGIEKCSNESDHSLFSLTSLSLRVLIIIAKILIYK